MQESFIDKVEDDIIETVDNVETTVKHSIAAIEHAFDNKEIQVANDIAVYLSEKVMVFFKNYHKKMLVDLCASLGAGENIEQEEQDSLKGKIMVEFKKELSKQMDEYVATFK